MSSPLTHGGRGAFSKAFTLIELLTVIAIIGILTGIAFGVMRGVNERAAVSQARTELAALSAALEAYKRQYGDYPQTGPFTDTNAPTTASATDNAGRLFNALGGKLGPKLAAINGKAVVEFSRFSMFTADIPSDSGTTSVSNGFIDPWGRAYIYAYRANGAGADTNWKNPTYLLLSAGPDGKVTIPANGIINKDAANNVDNVYPF